jgi:hypothetical protein
MDKPLFSRCDGEASVKDCLLSGYKSKIEILKSESEKMTIPYGADGDVAASKMLLSELSGVYKKRFKNGDTSGNSYISEDVFEFVPVSDRAAYIKMRLNFFNGHGCGIAGIAEYKKVGGFVYSDKDKENSCLLTVKLNDKKITFSDPNGNCQKFCGARGGFGGETFDMSVKREIQYLPIILNSREYQSSLRRYQKEHPEVK